ncbi:MAG: nucleotidyl transferase, partial [Chloroflexi bacterium]|nr:nucleotidyl transferase [Chloroflexota bacterium]
TQFVEKPSWGEVISDTVNTGIYVLDPAALSVVPQDTPFDFSKDLFPKLLENGAPLGGFVASGYWCDVGDHTSYAQANADFLGGKIKLPMAGQHTRGNVWVADDVEIAADAQVYGPALLGRGVKLKEGVVIHGPTVVGDYTVVDAHAHLDRSIVWRNSYIGERAEVRGAVICRQCRLKAGAVMFEGAVLGDNCVVGEDAFIHPNVRVWPNKEIETGATIKSSIVWGAQGRRTLFGRFGVTGLVNVELTPEFAAKLSASFGATMKVGSIVTVNRDLNRASRMIKRAIVAGLPSAGVSVIDLENVPIPVARFYTRATRAAGGMHVRLSPYDRRVIDIKFFDPDGLPIGKSVERNIERAFFREDFRRVYLDDIGKIDAAPEVIERYSAHFTNALNVEAIRSRKYTIVVDYANAPVVLALPKLFNELGCTIIALNAPLDPDKMSMPRAELDQGLDLLGRITGATRADFGVRFDVGGERLFAVNAEGQRIGDPLLAGALAELSLRKRKGGKLAVPANASSAADRIAEGHGAQVVRTRLDSTALMLASSQPDVVMAADGAGHFIFPEFQPVPDALFAACKLLELLATEDTTVQDVIAALPPRSVAHRSVACALDAKGRVMRRMHERYEANKVEQAEGLRLEFDLEWVLVLPDPELPQCHIYAESASASDSQRLAEKFAQIVGALL